MIHFVLFGRGTRSRWFAGAAAAALLATAAQAQPSYPVNIAAGGLEPALLTLASQTKQQIFFPKALALGLRAPPLKGSFTTEDALARLLVGTRLHARRVSPELIVIERDTTPSKATPAGGDTEFQRPFVLESAAPPAAASPEAPQKADLAVAAMTPTTVEELEVTGTHIRGGHNASPMVVVTRDDLDRSGRTTVVAALRTLPQVFAGGAAEGAALNGADNVARNGTASTAINLRGLGVNATLVLVNGRRMASSGTFGDFADVSAIPTAAVERVEVLLDGASAIYGSDAVGGVVNIILRRDYQGAETRLLAGTGTAGEPLEGQVSQTFGRRWDGGGMLLSYELQRRDALPSAARRFTETSDLRALGGTDLRQVNAAPGNILRTDPATGASVPGWAIPSGQTGIGLRPTDLIAGTVNLQNQRLGLDTLPRQTLQAVYLAADQAVGERLHLSGDARYSFRRFKSHLAAPTSNLTVTRANPFFVSPVGATSHIIAYSFANDLPSQQQTGSSENLGATFGGDLDLARDWRAEGYVTFAQEIGEMRNSGALNSLALNEALGRITDRPDTSFSTARDGFFNPFVGIAGANSPAVLAFIGSGFLMSRTKDQVSSASLQADGTFWTLPAGPVKLAFGVQARRETLARSGSNFVATVAPVAVRSFDAARDVTAGFVELQAPLFGPTNRRPGLERLEVSVAGRVEHYEAIGSTANPKLGLLWSPADGVLLRATYGRSFRAPALREVSDPAAYNPSLFPLGTTRVRTLLLNGGNPDLKPETARSWTLGVDVTPARWPGLTLAATGFDIRFHDRIDQPVVQNLTGALTDPNLSAFVTRLSPTNPADLARITALLSSPALSTLNGVFRPEDFGAIVDNRYVNTTTLHVRGLDVSGAYRFDLGDDQIALGANATYTFDFDQQITPTSPVIDRAGVANFPVKLRGRATADWTRGRLTAGGAVNFVDAYHDALGARIDSLATVDLQLRLAPAETGIWRGVAVILNVRNAFDRDPPFYNNVAAGIGFDAANADPIGRYVSLQLTRTW